jgi:hypothetical protein
MCSIDSFLHKTGAREPRCVLKQCASCIRNS